MMENCYIHIPFCSHICSYCDFCKLLYHEELVDQYLIHLEKEIKEVYRGETLETIYIGGGTPSSLTVNQLERLLCSLDILNQSQKIEYTIECNFESMTEEKLKLFKKYGVNRLSFGLESIHSKNLKFLERKASKDEIREMIHLCKLYGFYNINIDLMYAIPNESLEELAQDIAFVLSLEPTHISTYSLIIEPHTKLFINHTNYIDEDLDSKMYQLICNQLGDVYIHYEISNFCKKGYESIHNLCYWKNKNYYGFGLGASSYIGSRRIHNTRSIRKYLDDQYILDYEKLKKSDIMSYEMILGLRLLEGVSKEEFRKKYHQDIKQVFPIERLLSQNLICDNGNIYIPVDNMYISNEILVNFLKE
ncbi:MAG: radical SAM family heme chaperone HemW [Bacilli bacterium]|nr:radical SAM family heme chaperone HemW [Bacilli bacterium]